MTTIYNPPAPDGVQWNADEGDVPNFVQADGEIDSEVVTTTGDGEVIATIS